MLAAIIIAFLLVFCGVIREYWLIYAFAAELIISVISYIYTSRYAIKHSGEALNVYHQYCNDLDTMLSERGIKSRQFLEEIISRYKAINNNTNKKMEQNHDRINQAMKILVIPISVAVLGELLKKARRSSIGCCFGNDAYIGNNSFVCDSVLVNIYV